MINQMTGPGCLACPIAAVFAISRDLERELCCNLALASACCLHQRPCNLAQALP